MKKSFITSGPGKTCYYLTLFILMDYSILIDTISKELSILYFKGLLVKSSLDDVFLSMKIYKAAFHLCFHCLLKYLFSVSRMKRVKST